MIDTATFVLAAIVAFFTWTASVALLALWLSNRFRAIEILIYREMNKHRREDDEQFTNHGTRIQRLEIKAFGFTVAEPPRSTDNQSLGPLIPS